MEVPTPGDPVCVGLGTLEVLPGVPCRSRGVTGWDALVAPLAMGSQLLTHIPP